MAVRVGTYKLAILSSVEEQPSVAIATRAIWIKPHVSYQGQVQSAFVLFYPQPSNNLRVSSNDKRVYARLD